MPTEGNESAFDALIAAMKATPRPLALLGAGTSVDSGYPTWPGLMTMLAEKARETMSPKYGSVLDELNDPPWLAEEYRRLMGEHAFCDLIASKFGPTQQLGAVLRLVVQLDFRHILTTNYDPSIEQAYREVNRKVRVIDWKEETNLRQFFLELSRDGAIPYLLYLHGRYYDPANVILTESSYASRYVRSDDAQRKLFAILITQPVVFIGFSVNDPDLNQLMREVNARLGSGNPHHFALIGYRVPDECEMIRNRFQRKFGIEPVFYHVTYNDDGSENHAGLTALLHEIFETIHGRPPVVDAAVEPVPPTDAPTPDSGEPQILDPLDHQKGRWGRSPRQNGRVLFVENVVRNGETYAFDLVVQAEEGTSALEGEVIFHLHQSFRRPEQHKPVVNGRAVMHIQAAYGVFTVGAQADGGATQLELDLAELDVFEPWFRER